jgi:hypothetical protein
MNVIDYITITCNLKNVRLQITSDYMKKCNRLQLIMITPCLRHGRPLISVPVYTYITRLKIEPNSVRIRFLSCQIFVLPSTGFELTPLIHCSTNHLALCPGP